MSESVDNCCDEEPQRPCFFLCLAVELQCHILEYLSYKDIIRCAQTCRSLLAVILTSTELQYQIELGAHRLRFFAVDDESTHRRYRLLREKTRAWSLFDLNKVDLRVPLVNDGDFDDCGMSFADGCLSLYNESLDNCSARLVDLDTPSPSQSRTRAWTPGEIRSSADGLAVICTLMDVWQDLLLCASIRTGFVGCGQPLYQIGVRTISGGPDDYHPLAADGVLFSVGSFWGAAFRFDPGDSQLQVHGDYTGLFSTATADGGHGVSWLLQVWNWKRGGTSMCVLQGSRDYHSEPSMHDFCFLGSDRVMVLTRLGHIEIYSYADLNRPLRLQARFILPVLAKAAGLYPCLCPRSVSPQTRKLRGQIYAIATWAPNLLIAISNDIFLPHIPPFPGVKEDRHGVYTVPWDIWGPANCRAFSYDSFRGLLFGLSGSRLLWGKKTTHPRTGEVTWTLSMADFNPVRMSRVLARSHDYLDSDGREPPHRRPRCRVVCETEVLVARAWTLETRLPYVEMEGKTIVGDTLEGILMDEDRVVLIRRHSGIGGLEEGLEVEVTTF
ncbi:hypothetical protein BU15DRAFT_66089 [Melanogaster broomeanus]|nr:hypothetical protein BU15DRAFT_66089 [Melanogaster broomeanus]